MVQIAAAIIINKQGQVLIGQRRSAPDDSCAGLWEFPGGKIEHGESQMQCLSRECWEEVGLAVRVGGHYETVRHVYPERTVEVSFWLAQVEQGIAYTFVHDALKWVEPRELEDYAFCPANAAVIKRLAAESPEKLSQMANAESSPEEK